MKMRRKTIQIVFLTICFVLNVFAQESGEPAQKEDSKIPIKVDEFGKLGGCDLNARVQNFFIELNNDPSATGYIIVYQGKNELPANRNLYLMEKRIQDEMRLQALDSARIVFVRGGFRNEIATELFRVPSGAAAPEPTDTISAPTTPKDKTFLYDSKILYDDYYDFTNEFILPSVTARIEEENRLAEEQAKAEESNSEEAIEPKVEAVEENFEIEKPTPEEIEEAKFSWVNEKFGEIIKKQKDSRGVIIFYADDAYYDVVGLKSLIEAGKQKIAEFNKIPVAKIQIVYGGYRDMVQAEFWIVPKKGESPTPRPEERPVEETEN